MDIKLISASRVKTYEHCKYKYVLSYMLFECSKCNESFYTVEMAGMNQCPYCGSTEYHKPAMESNWGAVHGGALHDIMEHFALAIRGTLEDGTKVSTKEKKEWLNWRKALKAIYKRKEDGSAIYDLAKPKDVTNTDKWCKGCKAGGNALCEVTGEKLDTMIQHGCQGCPKALYEESEILLGRYIDRYEPILKQRKILGVETQFDISMGELDIHKNPIRMFGYMDLVTELDSDTIELVDHKFGSWVPSFEEFVTDLQVKMYSVACRMLFPQYKEYIMTFDYIRKNPLSYAFTAEDDECTKQEIIEHWKNIAAPQAVRRTMVQGDGKDPNTSWKCRVMCDPTVCIREWAKFKDKFGAT